MYFLINGGIMESHPQTVVMFCHSNKILIKGLFLHNIFIYVPYLYNFMFRVRSPRYVLCVEGVGDIVRLSQISSFKFWRENTQFFYGG